MLLCHLCLSSLHHRQQRNLSVYRYYELHNSEYLASPETRMVWLHQGAEENGDRGGELFGPWVIDGMAKEMVWKRMLRQAVNWPGIDLILCALLIWPCHGEIEKPKWMWGCVHSPEPHRTDNPTMNLKMAWNTGRSGTLLNTTRQRVRQLFQAC